MPMVEIIGKQLSELSKYIGFYIIRLFYGRSHIGGQDILAVFRARESRL
jgi:hypothetical protein